MAIQIKKVPVWAGTLRDVPGGLADVLANLADAGANIEFIIARRDSSRPGMGQVFLTPIRGRKAEQAASSAGLTPATDIGTLRVEGADRPGLGHRMMQAIADAGINVRGVSAAVLNKRFVAYFGFDSSADADAAARAMKKVREGAGAAKARKPARRRAKARR